ncbi:ABC-2 family transporter protein [Streptomyces sp. NPDC050704]|uniref:ABC transporter permease n=1 Tax=Streptomyces sp. NPDC050704 TaxID=3157219 RepID=UPI00341CEC42
MLNPFTFSAIPERIRDGRVAIDLVRPLSFPIQMICAQSGVTLAMLPFALLAIPFAVLIGGAQQPPSAASAILWMFSSVLGYIVTVLLATMVGMLAFWTLEVSGIFMVYRMVGQLMSGALIPLWFMPEWLQSLALWLPFQGTTYTPLAIYVGQLQGILDLCTAVGRQLAWLIVLCVILRTVWTRAWRRVVVQGG